MNIVFISEVSAYVKECFGGAEVSMRLLAEQLANKGHRVSYITKDHGRGIIPVMKKSTVLGVRLYIFRVWFGEKRIACMKRVHDIFFKYGIKQVIKKSGAQIVYCSYDLGTLAILLQLRSDALRYNIVMRMAGMYWYDASRSNPAEKSLYEQIFNCIDGVNYVTPALQSMVHDKLGELGMKASFHYEFSGDIGCCAVPGRPKPYDELSNKRFTIIMASRFSNYQKRQDMIVQAVSLINPSFSLHVKLIGDGKRRSQIQQMIDQMGLNDRIEIIPFMDQKELWDEMLQADLLCHACDYEGVSKIILESMALGLPVLASNVDPVNSYVQDGFNGFLVDNDPRLWAEKIKLLVNDRVARVRVSLNSTEYIIQNFDPSENVTAFEHHFTNIIGTNCVAGE